MEKNIFPEIKYDKILVIHLNLISLSDGNLWHLILDFSVVYHNNYKCELHSKS